MTARDSKSNYKIYTQKNTMCRQKIFKTDVSTIPTIIMKNGFNENENK